VSAPVVEIVGLQKRIGRVTAVDDLTLVVEEGQVLGLAGPNGSGKSVTLKVLLSLVRPTRGEVRLFGERVRPGAPVLRRVGALVDGPGFVPHLSGIENLRLARRLTRRPLTDADLDRVLDLAGLGAAIDRPYQTYSHGMRYRLGLAQATLGRPDLLLLDEPTTGLDPEHIREVRAAIAAAAARGATVVLSSHLLTEVEQVCTHAAVMQAGRLVARGRIDELTAPADVIELDVDDPVRADAALRALPGVRGIRTAPGRLRVEGRHLPALTLLTILDAAGVSVRALRRGQTLEDAYLDLLHPPPPVATGTEQPAA
jgi:ABC-2 type transport system ATP-binding protein